MNSSIINRILEKDHVFGKLCSEAEHAYKHKNYFSALVCLFVISEQIIKHSINIIDGNFYQATVEAREKDLINDVEFKITNDLRKLRNKIFHENHYSMGIEINGIYFLVSEDEIKEILYNKFSYSVFLLVLRLI